MPSYLKKDNNLLIVPNKCASMYVDAVCSNRIITDDQVRDLLPAITTGRIQVTAIKRDPVYWYWSGYWHVSSNRDILPVPPSRWTPKQHWRLALSRKNQIHTSTDSRFQDFDMHSWIDPWHQVFYDGLLENNISMPNHIAVNWVELNSQDFRDVVWDFATDRSTVNEKLNVSAKQYWPMNDDLAKLIVELDDWSWRLGYDIQDSIKRYRKLERSHG